MKLQHILLFCLCSSTAIGCLELNTQNPPNGNGGAGGIETGGGGTGGVGASGAGATSVGGAGGGAGTGGMMAGSGGMISMGMCGNSLIDMSEECDDGNTTSGDGCSDCKFERNTSLFVGKPGEGGHVDGIGNQARLTAPTALAIFGDTLYFSSDTVVRMVDIPTTKVTTIAGAPGKVGHLDGPIGTDCEFDFISGLATDGGSLWVSDTNNNVLRRISLTPPHAVTTVAGAVDITGQTVDGTGANARLNVVTGITLLDGIIYMVDPYSSVLRAFNPVTTEVTTLAGLANMPGNMDGMGSNARFVSPYGISSDGIGNLYIADKGGHAIRKYDVTTNQVTTMTGFVGICGYTDGLVGMAQLLSPRGITFGDQNIYWAEYEAHTIRQLRLQTTAVSTISGAIPQCASQCACLGVAGGYAEGTGASALWNLPADIVYHGPSKSLFVADSLNDAIRRIQ